MARKFFNSSQGGFTVIEVLVVVIFIGIISAIVAPSWLGVINTQRLKIAQDQIYRAMRQAQSNANSEKTRWQVSFRETTVESETVVQWAVHPVVPGQFIPTGLIWNNLDPNIQIYKAKNQQNRCETTLDQETNSCPAQSPWRVQFNYKGHTNGQLGQITLITKNSSQTKRCVYVSTLLGALRTGEEHSRPNSSDKYCY